MDLMSGQICAERSYLEVIQSGSLVRRENGLSRSETLTEALDGQQSFVRD